jgi:hypothetical protein
MVRFGKTSKGRQKTPGSSRQTYKESMKLLICNQFF